MYILKYIFRSDLYFPVAMSSERGLPTITCVFLVHLSDKMAPILNIQIFQKKNIRNGSEVQYNAVMYFKKYVMKYVNNFPQICSCETRKNTFVLTL